MRILHVSDLHLGRSIESYDLIELQKDIIHKIEEVIEEYNVDVVVIAGDVYDKSLPSIEATKILNSFLTSIIKKYNKQVIIIAGNHDSYERLRYGDEMFKELGIYIASIYPDKLEKITIGEVDFYAWPYVSYFSLKEIYGNKSYGEILDKLISEIDKSRINCFIGHGYYTYNTEKMILSDSERKTDIGGAEFIDISKTFKEVFDIAMFGHLHNPQKVGRDLYRYSGSPIKYSFSEANSKKELVIYDVLSKDNIECNRVPLTQLKDVEVCRGNYIDILNDPKKYVKDVNSIIKVELLDEAKKVEPFNTLKEKYPNIISLEYVNILEVDSITSATKADIKSKTVEQLFSEFYKKQTEKELTEKEMEIINDTLDKAREVIDENN